SLPQPGHCSARRLRRARRQRGRQGLSHRVVKEKPARLLLTVVGLKWKLQVQPAVELPGLVLITYQQITRVIGIGFGRQRLEGHFRTNAGDVAERNANKKADRERLEGRGAVSINLNS